MQQTLLQRSLLADAQDGSERAFDLLIGPLVDPGYRYACAMLRDPEAARDAVQEASIKAWRKLRQVRTEDKVRPWFLSIVRNECWNSRRLTWTARVTTGLPDAATSPSEEDDVVRREDIRKALERLAPDDRAVVVLFFDADLPIEEVAGVVGLSISATRARLYRAVHKLRPDLDPEEALR